MNNLYRASRRHPQAWAARLAPLAAGTVLGTAAGCLLGATLAALLVVLRAA